MPIIFAFNDISSLLHIISRITTTPGCMKVLSSMRSAVLIEINQRAVRSMAVLITRPRTATYTDLLQGVTASDRLRALAAVARDSLFETQLRLPDISLALPIDRWARGLSFGG